MSLQTQLMKYCTVDLLETVFKDLNITDAESLSTIHVEEYVEHKDFMEIMKVLFVYEHLGGELYYKQKIQPSPIIFRDTNKIELTKITQFWMNSFANYITPVYDLGEIIVPKILPKYVVTETMNGVWGIERLYNGNYSIMDGEIYPTEEVAKQRALDLNSTDLD